jgi:hypothetical protein
MEPLRHQPPVAAGAILLEAEQDEVMACRFHPGILQPDVSGLL